MDTFFIDNLYLDDSESTLYADTLSDGAVYAFSTDGVLKWKSQELGIIMRLDFAEDAIVVGIGPEDNRHNEISSIVSLNYDGTMRWRFHTGSNFEAYTVGRNNRIYVKDQSGPYGNEATYILKP